MRVFLHLQYDGSDFYGLQIQPDKPTILGELERILAVLGIKQRVVASGRTDKGVHATMQICHIDLPPFWSDTLKLQTVLNTMLPKAIHVKKIYKVPPHLHARYSVKKRTYRYLFRTTPPSVFESRYISYLPTAEFTTIKQNIQLFEGRWDFSYFIKTGTSTSSTIRTIYKAFAYNYKGVMVLHFEAEGFLRTQIRFMVAALVTLKKEQLQNMLTLREKYNIKPAPPNGLFLAKIKY